MEKRSIFLSMSPRRCQQILLGMLTIFGPIQWAFSLLPKWEGAWAKWMTRYLTVHFYGAMLYFVGFYVLLLFDIVLCIQVENLTAITASEQTMAAYLQNSFFSAGYLMAASIVALKCLNLVPDLAAWMIPEGDTAFSTRNFGEGVASQAKMSTTPLPYGTYVVRETTRDYEKLRMMNEYFLKIGSELNKIEKAVW